jgi:hypothetical protein
MPRGSLYKAASCAVSVSLKRRRSIRSVSKTMRTDRSNCYQAGQRQQVSGQVTRALLVPAEERTHSGRVTRPTAR